MHIADPFPTARMRFAKIYRHCPTGEIQEEVQQKSAANNVKRPARPARCWLSPPRQPDRERKQNTYIIIYLFIYIWCMYIYIIYAQTMSNTCSSWWNNSKHADCSRSVLHSDELSRGVSPNTRSDHFQILIVLYSSWIVFSLVSLASCIPLD